MSRKRINFTIAHEIIHFLYHINQENHTFFDTRETLKLTDEDYLVEFQANVGASAILLPDSVLIFELKQGTKPSEISDKYGISESAFSRRLTQTMEAEFAASHDAAYRTTMKIMNKYGNAGKSTMMELGRNLERKIVYANPFYEALII